MAAGSASPDEAGSTYKEFKATEKRIKVHYPVIAPIKTAGRFGHDSGSDMLYSELRSMENAYEPEWT